MPKSRKSTGRALRTPGAVSRIDRACRRAVLGKLAVRDIAAWVAAFGLGEIEFRLLWLLFTTGERQDAATVDFDQAELAARLAVSPAQVSAVVDRSRAAGHIAAVVPAGDRRRQLWRLTASGRDLVHNVVTAVDALPPAGAAGREAA